MPPTSSEENPVRYARPHKADRVTARLLRGLVRMGIGPWGARELRVPGRKSGLVRSNVVNVLKADDGRYLVAPRGNTEWVRNLRAAGRGELRLGHGPSTLRPSNFPTRTRRPCSRPISIDGPSRSGGFSRDWASIQLSWSSTRWPGASLSSACVPSTKISSLDLIPGREQALRCSAVEVMNLDRPLPPPERTLRQERN